MKQRVEKTTKLYMELNDEDIERAVQEYALRQFFETNKLDADAKDGFAVTETRIDTQSMLPSARIVFERKDEQ